MALETEQRILSLNFNRDEIHEVHNKLLIRQTTNKITVTSRRIKGVF